MNNTTTLSDRQNASRNLKLLAAASTFNGAARRIRAIEITIIVALPCVLSVAAAFFHSFDTLAAFSGFVLSLLDVCVLYPIVSSSQRAGAQVQEFFDIAVLRLPSVHSRLYD